LIVDGHIRDGMSLREIERVNGLANGCLSSYAKRHAIPVRSKAAQARLDFSTGKRVAPAGERHWSWGQTKETHPAMAMHSARMTQNNPSRMPGVIDRIVSSNIASGHYKRVADRLRNTRIPKPVREKIAKTVAPQLLERISHREQMMREALIFDPRWIAQHRVNDVVLDFACPELMIAFEIDVGGHKLDRSLERDMRAVSYGWTIFRFRADLASDPSYFLKAMRIAEKAVPDFKCPDEPPTGRRCYGVVIRCAEHPTGLRVHNPNDPALVLLRSHIQNRAEAARMRQDEITN